MQRLIEVMSGLVERRPAPVLIVLALVTVVLTGFASQLDVETDVTEFAGEAPRATALQRIIEEFGIRGGGLQVIVDAGRGGNVLSPAGLEVGDRVGEIAEESLGGRLADETPGRPPVISYADVVLAGLANVDIAPEDLSEPFVAALLGQAVEQQGDEIRSLYSDDLDVDDAEARGGLVVVQLAPGLDAEERESAGVELRDRLAAEPFGFFDVDPFSVELLEEELEQSLFEEMPLLLVAALGLIVVLLWLLFRSVVDVVIGLVGLLIVQIWFAGLATALGPDFLGVTGPFSQIAIAVPVLLVGLGVDYAVHLVSRAREERAGGKDPAGASGQAIRTVGVALLLVTVTTMVGFLSNLQSPLPPIRDFGVFTATGMFAAFVVMTLFVPAARQLFDRRGDGLSVRAPGGGEDSGFSRGLARASALAIRAPVTVIVVGVVLAVGGTIAALDLETRFAQEDFIPEGTTADVLLTRMDELFGGDVTEETFLLIEGDLTDPRLLDAMLVVEQRLPGVDDVRAVEDGTDVMSPRSLIEQLEDAGRVARERLVEQARVASGDLPVDVLLPLPDAVEPEDLPDDLEDVDGLDDVADPEADDGSDLPDGAGVPGGADLPDGAGVPGGADLDLPLDGAALEDRLPPDVSPQDALGGLLDEEEVAQLLREGAGQELRDELIDQLGAATAERLAALDPAEVDLQTLATIGYPMADLDDATADLLALVEDLEELGWQDGTVTEDADVEAIYQRVEEIAEEDLAQVLTGDRRLALMMVPTEAGQDGAEELAVALRETAEPVRALADDVMVVSQELVGEETLDLLVEAQVEKILFSIGAAFLLLVAFYLVTQRRPMLGLITMVPTLLALPLVLGAMWVIGLPFNALTATIASVAIGFGVDYGIHLGNRFREERQLPGSAEDAVRRTVAHTGAALVGSAATTSAAFGVLLLSTLLPVAQFGVITALTMIAALVTTVLVQSSCLLLWERHHRRRAGARESGEDGQLVGAGSAAR